ncbi:MAG: choice-of-anchor R domain-containing protein [Chloroflexota bacterium]
MSEFSVQIFDRSGEMPLTIADVSFEVQRYSFSAIGGPRQATVTVNGASRALWDLIEWLRAPVEIYDRRQSAVWWGYLAGVELNSEAIRVKVTLDGMANRAAVAYAHVEVGSESAGVRATTAWQQNDDSAAIYGIKELLAQIGTASGEQATAARDALLADKHYPVVEVEILPRTGGTDDAILHLRGWWETLGWRYYSQLAGKEAHEADGAGVQDMGRTSANQRVGQGIQLASAAGWEAAAARVKLRKVGSPTDTVIVDVCANAGGLPGGVLVSGSAEAANISTTIGWHTFNFAALPGGGFQFLQPGTTYWLVVKRSGAVSNDHYYQVDVDEGLAYARGVMRLWNGSAWVSRAPDADLNFQVLGGRETTLQIADIVAAGGQFLRGTLVENRSNVISNPYRRGDNTALHEIEELLRSGTADGMRLLAQVNRNREVVIALEAQRDAYMVDLLVRRDGTVENRWGDPYYAQTCPVGVWAQLKDVIPSSLDMSRLADASLFFVEDAEYDALRGVYVPTARGQRQPHELASKLVEG